MYLSFYGLREKPFNSTPDPRFLYPTPGHLEALAQLLYGLEEGKGFLVLTAEIGTGKTTVLQALLQKVPPQTEVAFLFNSTLPFEGIIEYLLADFGIPAAGSSHAQRLMALNAFLLERHQAGLNTVFILDEAQNLDPLTMEQIRLLSNFETPRGKLLQILLAGQPELQAKLRLPQLRQLKQRVSLHCSLPLLTTEETAAYIRHRLRVAGGHETHLFTERAILCIDRYARGVPRLINLIADHCLLIGYSQQRRVIGRTVAEQAITYLEGDIQPRRRRWWNFASKERVPHAVSWWRRWLAASAFCLGAWFSLWELEAVTAASHQLTGQLHTLASTMNAAFLTVLHALQQLLFLLFST